MVIESNYISNLQSLKDDVFLNKEITNLSPSNLYEFLFESETLDGFCDYVIDLLKKETNENFDLLVKTIYGYIQDEEHQEQISIDKKLKEGLITVSKYSFILNIQSKDTSILINEDLNNIKTIKLDEGKLIIFRTEDFLRCESSDVNRVLIVGGLSNDITKTVNKKSLI